MLGKMVTQNGNFPGGYYRNAYNAAGESEGSGSSGRIDAEFTASEDSSGPVKKCISLNSEKGAVFYVPFEVFPMSRMTPSERKALVHRLKMDLEQIRVLQKKIELQRGNGVAVSSSNDILSCNGRPQPHAIRKSAASTPGRDKKVKSLGDRGQSSNGNTLDKIKPVKQVPAPKATDELLMSQCEALLKRLMTHVHGWVFNSPVDVKALNLPDYFTIIKHPMDLGTVKGKLNSGAYSNVLDFASDVRLTFTNAKTYNPPGNDVHIMANVLSKLFESKWKPIEKKLVVADSQPPPVKSGLSKEKQMTKPLPPAKKRKISSIQYEVVPEPVKPVMSAEEKHELGRQLEGIMGEMPDNIINFLRENSSSEQECGEDEIEIDIDDLSVDTLFTLKKLVDDYLLEKQESQARDEQCEIVMLNESGYSNSSNQPSKVNGDEDVDIGGNEPPVSSYPQVKEDNDASQKVTVGVSRDRSSDSDLSSSSDSESDPGKASNLKNAPNETLESIVQMSEKQSLGSPLDINQPVSKLDQLDEASLQKPSSLESANSLDGESAPDESQMSPGKRVRVAELKKRFADTILKAREKTLSQKGDSGDPEKLRREQEELEMQRRKEKARIDAEVRAAEAAKKKLEAEALVEAKRKMELEREAARQALLKMEKTVEINENSRFLEDLEMLSTIPVEQLPSSADETSPDNNSLDRLGSFKFGGGPNPLEQLGLFMKADDEEEEAEPPAFSSMANDVEEGEIN